MLGGMSKFYELSFEIQIKKLRNTTFLSIIIGAIVGYELLLNHHHFWALLTAIISLQVAIGSAILMGDIRKDLKSVREIVERKD